MKNITKPLLLVITSIILSACNSGGGSSGGGGSVLSANPQPFQQFYPNGSPFTPNNFGSAKIWSTGNGDLNFTIYQSSNYQGVNITFSGNVQLNSATCFYATDNYGDSIQLTNCSQSTSGSSYQLNGTATDNSGNSSSMSISTAVLPSGSYLAPSNCYNISTSGTMLLATCLATNGYTTYNVTADISTCPTGPVAWNPTTKVLACSS